MVAIWDLKYIKEMRTKLGLTQHQLAKLAGVSQSLIAKIERGSINPSFDAVKKIYIALENVKAERERSIKAGDISTKEILYVNADDKVQKAIDIMIRYDVSQLPVFERDKPVGSISESTIIRNLNRVVPNRTIVREIMDESFPIVPENTSLSLIKEILMEYQAVLTQRNGKITGIVTKADILKIFNE